MMTKSDLTEVAKYLLAQKQLPAMTEALEALLTPYEQEEVIHRLQIFTLLTKGLSQREISKQLGVGIATVTRGSKALQAGKFHPEKLDAGKLL
jgi:TrpR family trp operon transcriptional repressor